MKRKKGRRLAVCRPVPGLKVPEADREEKLHKATGLLKALRYDLEEARKGTLVIVEDGTELSIDLEGLERYWSYSVWWLNLAGYSVELVGGRDAIRSVAPRFHDFLDELEKGAD